MKFRHALVSAAAFGAAVVALQPASAALGDDLIVANDGNVFARFDGGDAGDTSELFLVTFGGNPIFNNKTTPIGTVVDLGFYTAGTKLVFGINDLSTGETFYTGNGALNSDGIAHALVSYVPGGTAVGFEDLLGGGDKDYNDLLFSFTNTGVPEPASWAMMIGGFGLVGASMRRRNTKMAVTYA